MRCYLPSLHTSSPVRLIDHELDSPKMVHNASPTSDAVARTCNLVEITSLDLLGRTRYLR